MKFRSKKERLQAIIAAYQLHRPGPFTMNALAEWALANHLYPVPKRGDPVIVCRQWEAGLEMARLPRRSRGWAEAQTERV
jgi:hypothetical protein